MKAVCVTNVRTALVDNQQTRAAAFESPYPLTVGRAYTVVGMSLTENILHFLVENDQGDARFAPAAMFDLLTAPLPSAWTFKLASGVRASGRQLWADPIVALWGYPELVEDPEHFADIVDEDPEALAVFKSRLAEADDQA